MLSSAQLLTTPTSHANYEPDDISSTARSLINSSFLFLQVDRGLAKEEERMAQNYPRPDHDTELWFSMPSSARREEERVRSPEPSAYQASSSRHSFYSSHRAHRSASPSQFPSIPSISTTAAIHKPLPPSPKSEKKKPMPASIRSLIWRRPSDQHDPSHLQPGPYQQPPTANDNLSPDPYPYYGQNQFSRSMPTSPAEFSETSMQPAYFGRTHSAAANYSDPPQYQAYSQQPQPRAVSMNTYFESQPARARRTFPETNSPSSATLRDSVSDRPRPHTWLSPIEPFEDASEFHLFVEATSGLPDGALDFDALSPNGPPRLQGSLFARGRQNDIIPIPLQYPSCSPPSQSHQLSERQNLDYDYIPPQPVSSQLVSSSALPCPDTFYRSVSTPNLNEINLELERLGLDDDNAPEDELPDYAQSQAEMASRRRQEATDRARELEARWNSSRAWEH